MGLISPRAALALQDRLTAAAVPLLQLQRDLDGHPPDGDYAELLKHTKKALRELQRATRAASKLAR